MGRSAHNNFDGLRLIGALLVLFSHQFALIGLWEPRFVGDHSFGNLGVLIFFSISGYLIAASWDRDPDLGRFLAKRFLRMAPALAVSVPLTFAVVTLLGLRGFPDNTYHALNGSLWTIPLEVNCYLLFVGIAMLTRHAAASAAALALAAHFVPEFRISFTAYFGLFFAVGALLYRYRLLQRFGYYLLIAGVSVIYFAGDTVLGLALIVPPAVVYVGQRSWWLLNRAGRFGDLSYGIYIYAWPVQQIGAAYLPDAGYLTLLAISTAVTVPLAWMSWRLIESRALRAKPVRDSHTRPLAPQSHPGQTC